MKYFSVLAVIASLLFPLVSTLHDANSATQNSMGLVKGIVEDPQGTALSGVSVIFENESTKQRVTSDEEGGLRD